MTVTTLYDRATERTYQEQLEREEAQEAAAKEMLRGLLLDALRRGQDVLLPTGNPRMRYPVSEYLGECQEDARHMLFKACVALQHRNEADVLIWLRKFVDRVADDYAADYHDAFMGMED